MSIELHVGGEVDRPGTGPVEAGGQDRERPHVSGDLPSVLGTGPMFRRAVAGYDRFQVDTYVQWAEDELATADREREHLLAGHLRTQAELDEARELLAHSSGGGEFLQLSRRIGSMLASAADQADGMHTEAQAERAAAAAEAARMAAHADDLVRGARTEADRLVADAAARAQQMSAEADRVVADAERSRREAHEEIAERLAAVRRTEQRAAEAAQQLRQRAIDEAAAARRDARAEIVRMLELAREERRRADAEAAGLRERLDRDATARRTALAAEVADLEHRRDTLGADLETETETDPLPAPSPTHLVPVRALLGRIHDRLGRQVPPRRDATAPPAGARGGQRTAA